MNDSLVSIVMPAYNAGRYIEESIRSVALQTYTNWELVVVDDGSIDNTAEVVNRFLLNDSRIKYIYQQNGRQGKARNNGIRHSTGALIAFLDSDDIWLPEKLDTQVRFLNTTGADLVYCDTYVFEDRFELASAQVMHTDREEFLGLDGLKSFLEKNRIPILTALCRREAILGVGGFTEQLNIQNAEDYHLWMKMLLNGCRFIGMDNVLAAYRQLPTSISGLDRFNMKQVIEAQIDIMSMFPEYKKLIYPYFLATIKRSLYAVSKYDDNNFYTSIEYYLSLYNKKMFKPVFRIFKAMQMRSLALRSTYFIFNYL